MSVVVLVPVLNRPQAAIPLAASLRATSTAFLVFLMTAGDRREQHAIRAVQKRFDHVEEVVVPFALGPGDYARKINHGVEVTSEDWIFQGADDLRFHPGWVEAALDAADHTGCRVIGTNDLCNPRVIRGGHSTHSLVHRSYVEEIGTVDVPGKMLHEGYRHNFCDDELVTAAKGRGEFISAGGARVEHLHPNCADVEVDQTYQRALDPSGFEADRSVFRARRPVYGKPRLHAGRR